MPGYQPDLSASLQTDESLRRRRSKQCRNGEDQELHTPQELQPASFVDASATSCSSPGGKGRRRRRPKINPRSQPNLDSHAKFPRYPTVAFPPPPGHISHLRFVARNPAPL